MKMSNDFISRSEVMELIESKFVDGCFEQGDKTLIDGYGLLNEVSDLPIAYDVDKVVEQMELRKSYLLKEFVLADKALSVKETSIARIDEIGWSIEIVKAGGANNEKGVNTIL